ncbi:MAG TPA: M23 family metallopeptidase [Rectinemataceae bacterium]|nr:M23 family metallopeptidase [Rectinemataceae bacterium]
MRIIFFLRSSIVVASLALVASLAPSSAQDAQLKPPQPALVLQASSVRQGDPIFAECVAEEPVTDPVFELRDSRGFILARGKLFALFSATPGTHWGAVTGIAWNVAAGPAVAELRGQEEGRPFIVTAPLLIEAREFALEEIPLDKANTEIRAVPDPEKTAEALAIWAIYARTDPGALWASLPFVAPVGKARRSAGFGDRRRYLYAGGGSDTAWHSGIDFAVPVGTPVHAPAAGRIIFSGPRIVTGYTMVIEHDPGLYSILMHLSKGIAAEGSMVKAGDVVALSGATGFATGPHLHWEVRAGEVPVDPDFFLAAGMPPFPWLDTSTPPLR